MDTLVLIDGDNIGESYVPAIFQEAKAFVSEEDRCEIHCFGTPSGNKNSWKDAIYKYGVEYHYCPSTNRRAGKPDLNTCDIALTNIATEKLYENPELKTIIFVTNDKDYVPFATRIRSKFRKRALMFYTEQDDSAVEYYDDAVLLSKERAEKAILISCIESLLEKHPQVFLNVLKFALKRRGVDYGEKAIKEYLGDMFQRFPTLQKKYVLKSNRITRIVN